MTITAHHGSFYGSGGLSSAVAGTLLTDSSFADVGTIALLFIAAQGAGQAIGDSADWTRIYSATGAGTRTHTQAAFYHVITADDVATPPSFSFPLDVSGPWDWGIMSYDGTDPSSPVAAYAFTASSGNGTSVVAPSVTTTRDDGLIVECFGGTAPTPSTPNVSAVDQWRGSWGGGGSDFPALGFADQEQPVAGSTGTQTSTLSVSGSWVAGTIALQPPPVSPPTPTPTLDTVRPLRQRQQDF